MTAICFLSKMSVETEELTIGSKIARFLSQNFAILAQNDLAY